MQVRISVIFRMAEQKHSIIFSEVRCTGEILASGEQGFATDMQSSLIWLRSFFCFFLRGLQLLRFETRLAGSVFCSFAVYVVSNWGRSVVLLPYRQLH